MSNPYESPSAPGSTPFSPDQDREKLRRVARYQRWVLYALLANIIINIAAFAARESTAANLLVLVVGLVVILAAMVSIFLLAKELINAVVAVLCAVLMIVPCISLIILLVINQKATSYLQQHGIKVGFMGVNPDRI